MTMAEPTPAGEAVPRLDHVGVLVRDLDAVADQWRDRFGLSVASAFEAPSLDLRARFLTVGTSTIELFTIDEPVALERALGRAPARIDHIALRFGSALGDLDLTGCTIRGPGRPDRIEEPFLIAGAEHVWTEPPGIDVLLQLITPAAAPR
ncbi:MAG TPA: VOC family protein [Amycolatopsis sp.]